MSEFLDKISEQEAELDRKIEQLVNQKVIDLYNRSGKKVIQPPYKKSYPFVFKEILEQDTKGEWSILQRRYTDGDIIQDMYNFENKKVFAGILEMKYEYIGQEKQYFGVVTVYNVKDAELLNKVSKDVPFRVEITVKVK